MSQKTALAHAVQQESSITPRVLTQQALLAQKRVELIDLRIGLHLLGQEGRMLLAQYIKVKSHQQMPRNTA